MPTTSNNYSFQQVSGQILIKEAFERIGLVPDELTSQQFDGALRSINLLLTDWSNRNLNFWTLEQAFIGLTPGVRIYSLPIQTLKVIQCELRTSQRNNFEVPSVLPAVPYTPATSSSGIAANAFDDNPLTSCTLNTNNGWIMYQYRNPNIINFIGINANNPNNANSWTVQIQGASAIPDPMNPGQFIPGDWFTLLAPTIRVYPDNSISWFNLTNIVPFTFYQLIQVPSAGETNLSIRELYFNNYVVDITMSEVSQYNYLQYPQKNLLGRPTVYYVNYQINPTLYIWQNPSPTYNCMFYSAQQMIQTVLNATDAIEIPSSFYDPLVWGLAYRLAQKYAIERTQNVEGVYRDSLDAAIVKNRVNLPLTIGLYGTGN